VGFEQLDSGLCLVILKKAIHKTQNKGGRDKKEMSSLQLSISSLKILDKSSQKGNKNADFNSSFGQKDA
jgi:hypothetical protein